MDRRRFSIVELRQVWRIVVVILVGQSLGGLVAISRNEFHSIFLNLWFGAAVGTLPGFLTGLIWQFRSASQTEWRSGAWFLGFLSLSVSAFAIGIFYPAMLEENRRIADLHTMPHEKIVRIDAYVGEGKDNNIRITQTNALTAFANAVADAVGYSPNHPVYSASWHVIVQGQTVRDLKLQLDPRLPHSVVGSFVTKSGNSTWYYGNFRSEMLRRWVDNYLIKRSAN